MPQAVSWLELLCCVEVGRMLIGDLRGNVVMGVILHSTRMFMVVVILPEVRDLVCRSVLLAWAVTEVGRYPCYICKSNSFLARVRAVARSRRGRDASGVVPLVVSEWGASRRCRSSRSRWARGPRGSGAG